MDEDTAWRFLSELANQLDDGNDVTAASVASALAMPIQDANGAVRWLRNRNLVDFHPTAPTRAAHPDELRILVITSAGRRASTTRNLEG